MQQALDALEPLSAYGRVGTRDVDQAALQQVCAALRSALAQPQAAPVAWYSAVVNDCITAEKKAGRIKLQPWDAAQYDVPLYATPQQAQPAPAPDMSCPECRSDAVVWECVACSATNYPPAAPAVPAVQPLTDKQVNNIADALLDNGGCTMLTLARAIERAHGIAAPGSAS